MSQIIADFRVFK